MNREFLQKLNGRAYEGKVALPVLPLRATVIFPACTGTVQVNRRRSLNLILDNKDSPNEIALVLLRTPDEEEVTPEGFHSVGVAARILNVNQITPDSLAVTFEGLRRISVEKFILEEPYFIAYCEDAPAPPLKSDIPEAGFRDIAERLKRLIELDHSYSGEYLHFMKNPAENPGYYADCVAALLHLPLESKQRVLEALDVVQRLAVVKQALGDEAKKLEIETELNAKVGSSIKKNQRETILREQLRQIHKELGEEDPDELVLKDFRTRLESLSHVPGYVRERVATEIERLRLLSVASTEYGATKNYIDLLLALPWNRQTEDNHDLAEIEKAIDQEYYGPKRIKERVMEYLVVRKLTAEIRNPVLCLVGPHGTGKSSLAGAITRGLGRNQIVLSAVGISAIEDIKGDMRTFPGAVPGKIMRALAECKSSNPVIIIDDLDKMPGDNFGFSLQLAMLEIFDPRQNKAFIDTYVGLPFDLSQIIFIATVEALDNIPLPLTERMEIIEFTGYIESEKIAIAQRFIIPRLLAQHNLPEDAITFSAETLRKLIRNYTLESGLINFKREIEIICRKVSRLRAVQPEIVPLKITTKNLDKYLGPPLYVPEMIESSPEIGVANGLAWTGSGGDLMLIEGIKMRGSGNVISTGSLGEVMRESIQAAHSYVRAKADLLDIDYNDFSNYDIHIHFPSGAIPKDGPSAGVTISTVIASLMSERPIANDLAMTGEVSLRGKVLQVSGVKEKIAAAHRAGIRKVILPKDNEKDIREMPRQILEEMQFIFVQRVDEVFQHALLNFAPNQAPLETLLRKEIDKVVKQTKRPSQTALLAKKKKRPPRKNYRK